MRDPNASTVSNEYHRGSVQKTDKNIFRAVQQRLGTITEVHPTLPMVRCRFNDGQTVAGNNFIGVAHSVLDIIQRFGQLRQGLRVLVTFSGEVEKDAFATVVGVEDERLGAELVQLNTFDSDFPWEIFTPGVGI